MKKYEEKIEDRSLWKSAMTTPVMLSLPFYVPEAGHFFAEKEYLVDRKTHDSFLLLFTVNGAGYVHSGTSFLELPAGHAAVIDCHKPHRYYAAQTGWEFLWMHLKGNSPESFFTLLYPEEPFAIEVEDASLLIRKMTVLMDNLAQNDILHSLENSERIHEIWNLLVKSSLKKEASRQRSLYSAEIEKVLAFLSQHYGEQISIEDMIADVPISKYHFIRIFRRIMGVTPYHYLMHYRLNAARMLLRTTNLPVAQIAEQCGFLDTGNFISQFKRHTGQTPLSYRRYFQGP